LLTIAPIISTKDVLFANTLHEYTETSNRLKGN